MAKMKLGTIDGLSFKKSRSHQAMSQKDGYNNLRSHGYAILHLCKELGVSSLDCSTDTGDTGIELNPKDDMSYSLLSGEFDIKLGECKHADSYKYGILVQTLVNENYIHRLEDFVDSVDYLYIYSSDYEYEVRKNTFELKFIFEWMRTTSTHIDLVNKIKSKLVVAFCGWYHISRITPYILGIKCEFLPQLINPWIAIAIGNLFSVPKIYDGFLMGMNDDVVNFMKMSDKSYLSVQYRDYSVPHTEYRNVTQVLQSGTSSDVITISRLASMCKYHCITNSWKTLYPSLLENSDMYVNQTFKIFEAYYSYTYPINPAMNWKSAHKFMDFVDERNYESMNISFRKSMKENYSYEKFKHVIKNNLS